MLKRTLITALLVIVAAAGVAYLNHKAIVLYVVTHVGKVDVVSRMGPARNARWRRT